MIEETVTELVETAQQELAELKEPLADATDTASRTVAENIGLTLIGGLAIGLAVGALLPLGRRRKQPPKKAARALVTSLATSLSELSQTLAAQARDRAETASEGAREKLSDAGKSIQEHSESLSKQTKKLADNAAGQLNDSGKAIARQVIKAVEKVRR